eukprot:5289470-Pleurochrysis_carterae.AAC.4
MDGSLAIPFEESLQLRLPEAPTCSVHVRQPELHLRTSGFDLCRAGACAPSVQSEGAALRRALLRSSRRKSDDSGSRAAAAAAAAASAGGFGSNCASAASADSLSAEGSSQDSVAAEREAELAAVAFAEATRLAGGLVRKDRHFSMISTISATDGGEMPPDEALCAALAEWECAHAARTAAVKQIAELDADARSDDGAAELTGYRQANRYEAAGGALEVLTLKAEQSSPIVSCFAALLLGTRVSCWHDI